MPVFTWEPVAGASGYSSWWPATGLPPWSTGAFTMPAYAPRGVYADETTHYYWAVVPIVGGGCNSGFNTMQDNAPRNFRNR